MDSSQTRDETLFAWSDGGIALLVERSGDCWIIARSWLHGDSMTDVRRWRFACKRRLVGQMRRLVGERTADPVTADEIAASLAEWVAGPVRAG